MFGDEAHQCLMGIAQHAADLAAQGNAAVNIYSIARQSSGYQ